MAETSHDYHRGEMDIHAQRDTYVGFLRASKWGALAIAAAVLFLSLWFCTGAGFFGGFIAAVVLVIIGIAVLREKPNAPSH